MPFSASAAGTVSGGTCSMTEDCQAGPIRAIPPPTAKQSASNRLGVTMPSQARVASAVAPANAIPSATSATMRRSYMSAIAPAGIAIKHDRQAQRRLHKCYLVRRGRHLRHCPGGADALDQNPEIGQHAGEPDAPKRGMAQRGGDAVGVSHPGLERADHGLIVTQHRFTARHILCEVAMC